MTHTTYENGIICDTCNHDEAHYQVLYCAGCNDVAICTDCFSSAVHQELGVCSDACALVAIYKLQAKLKALQFPEATAAAAAADAAFDAFNAALLAGERDAARPWECDHDSIVRRVDSPEVFITEKKAA